jgi:predicted nucleic acid-binding protein
MSELYLDTNALIALLDPEDRLFDPLFAELESGSSFSTNSIAWHEFVRGPASPKDLSLMVGILENRILPCTQEDGELAAMLFDRTGRRRSSTADCLIAATALRLDDQLVTHNRQDFEPFVTFGLRIYSSG